MKKEYKELLGQLYTLPTAACSIALSALQSDADSKTLSEQLAKRTKEVIDGDLSMPEAMLIDQAFVLQAIFVNLTMNMHQAKYIKQMEAYGRMALRAQNQCQRTLKTLLEYKNPKRATFIKQLNQQFNQGEVKIEKKVKPANEILEVNHESRLDPRKTAEAIGSDPPLETVGEDNRTAHGTG